MQRLQIIGLDLESFHVSPQVIVLGKCVVTEVTIVTIVTVVPLVTVVTVVAVVAVVTLTVVTVFALELNTGLLTHPTLD